LFPNFIQSFARNVETILGAVSVDEMNPKFHVRTTLSVSTGTISCLKCSFWDLRGALPSQTHPARKANASAPKMILRVMVFSNSKSKEIGHAKAIPKIEYPVRAG